MKTLAQVLITPLYFGGLIFGFALAIVRGGAMMGIDLALELVDWLEGDD